MSTLTELIGAVARLDEAVVSRLLDAEPSLAQQALAAAATRGNSRDWYFERINHYAYAGDTALHLDT